MDTTPAILLRRTRFSETSLIIVWFTRDCGKIKTIAKGALRPKNRFGGFLDLFYECEIQFARSAKSEIHTLREVELRDSRENLRKEYPRVALASYFAELLDLAAEPDHAAPELYDLASRALHYLDENSASLRAMTHFESELTRLLGIQNPQKSATQAFLQAYHRLPSSRGDLLKLLKPKITAED